MSVEFVPQFFYRNIILFMPLELSIAGLSYKNTCEPTIQELHLQPCSPYDLLGAPTPPLLLDLTHLSISAFLNLHNRPRQCAGIPPTSIHLWTVSLTPRYLQISSTDSHRSLISSITFSLAWSSSRHTGFESPQCDVIPLH